MERKKQDNSGRMGILPPSAPLANPYVPFQEADPPKYEARYGLVRGTLFPGLDLPFMDMANTKEKPVTPMSELQALGFAIQELALYLDTHQDDRQALEMYRQYQQIYHEGIMRYSASDGPMSHGIPDGAKNYAWVEDPWPWDAGRQ